MVTTSCHLDLEEAVLNLNTQPYKNGVVTLAPFLLHERGSRTTHDFSWLVDPFIFGASVTSSKSILVRQSSRAQLLLSYD